MVGRFDIEDRNARNVPATWGFMGQAPSSAWARPQRKCACTKRMCVITAISTVIIIAGAVAALWLWWASNHEVKPELKDFTLEHSFKIDEEGKAPFLVSPMFRLFDLSGDEAMFASKYSDSSEGRWKTGGPSKVSEYARDMRKKVQIDEKDRSLSRALSNAFERAAQASMDEIFETQQPILRKDDDLVVISRHVQMRRAAMDSPARFLTQQAKEILLEDPPDLIYSKLGAFYAEWLQLGGLFRYAVMTEVEPRDVFPRVVPGIADLFGGPEAEIRGDWEKKKREKATVMGSYKAEATWRALGGDTLIWHALTAENFNETKKKWAASLRPGNVEPVRFFLRPIWKLLEDPAMAEKRPGKAEELRKFMVTEWDKWSPRETRVLDWAIYATWDKNLCLAVQREFMLGWTQCEFDRHGHRRGADFIYDTDRSRLLWLGSGSDSDCICASRDDKDVREEKNVWVYPCSGNKRGTDVQFKFEGNSIRLKHDRDWCLSMHGDRMILRKEHCWNQLDYRGFNRQTA